MFRATRSRMATLAGKQSNLTKMLHSLIELEYDAIGAYTVAIDRLDGITAKTAFEGFRADHMRHVRELSARVLALGGTPPDGGDIKAVLAKGKVYMGSLAEDKGILMAMRSNENDTNTAYENALENDSVTPELAGILQRNLEDERRHRLWIEDQLSAMRSESSAQQHHRPL
jgi:uncharacterized protein (TIGR02284 family)